MIIGSRCRRSRCENDEGDLGGDYRERGLRNGYRFFISSFCF